MEAASAAGRLRARRFERECERLRPLGEAYALRRFGSELSRADAEDVVAEVLIRLHERAERGVGAENLRALFFTSVHNAVIDLLRARAARPQTVALEAAASLPQLEPAPAERAEGRENVVRLQEALARMRDGYRQTILLRFGLGLTVPEIASHFGISETAAKKRVLRAGRQVSKRMAQVEGEEFCPQMRELARGFAFEREACGLASEAEGEALRAHFSHCGPCRSYLVRLRAELHELGSGALAALLGGERALGQLDLLHRLGHWAGTAADAAQGALDRVRHLALRAAPLSSGDGPAGAAMGTGQKIAAVCGAGAAATATCVLTGAVGPGLGAAAHHPDPPTRPPAKVRRLSSQEVPPAEAANRPAEPAPSAAPEPTRGAGSAQPKSEAPQAGPPQSAEVVPEEHSASPPSEFGIESGSSSSAQSAGSGSGAGGGSSSGATSGASGSEGSTSGGSVGFQG